MGEIFSAFGIDGRLIVIQMVNFAVLLFALWYFLYEPVLNIIKKRQEKIEQGVRDAEEAARVKDEAERGKKELLQKASSEAEVIVENATAHAKEREVRILERAEERANTIVLEAKERGEEESRRIKAKSEAEIAKLAVLAAERVLKTK